MRPNCQPVTISWTWISFDKTSATIELTIIDLHRKELQHGDGPNSHGLRVVTRLPFFRALFFFCRQQRADRKNNTRHKRGLVAPHSADTETNRHPQLLYLHPHAQFYVMVFSTCVMGRNYFRKKFNPVFLNGTFRVYV